MRAVGRGGLAVLVSALLLMAGAVPAVADETSSICSVTKEGVLGTSASVVGVQVQAFDCADRPVAFTGTVAVQNSGWVSGAGQVTGPTTAPAAVSSADGSPGVGLVYVGELNEGRGIFVVDVFAQRETAAFHSTSEYMPALALSRDERATNQPDDGLTHAAAE